MPDKNKNAPFALYNHFESTSYIKPKEYLYEEIGKILGLDKTNQFIILGAGNFGRALAKSTAFEQRGFHLVGLFDVAPEVVGSSVRGIPIQHINELEKFTKEYCVDIAALVVPVEEAPKLAADVVSYGIKAIWNFTPTDLSLPADVVLENVHLEESLMRLSYKKKAADEAKK